MSRLPASSFFKAISTAVLLLFAMLCHADPLARTNWFDSSGLLTTSPGHLITTFTNSEQFWTTYFASTNNPITLSQPGSQIRLTWTFTPHNVFTYATSAPIAIALAFTPDANRLTSDAAPPSAAYGGYASFMGAYSGQLFSYLYIGGRSDSSSSSPMLAYSPFNWPYYQQGWNIGAANYFYPGAPNGQTYTFIMTIVRNESGGLDYSSFALNGSTIVSQLSYTDPTPNTYTFNTVCLHHDGALNSGGTIDTTGLQVDYLPSSPPVIYAQPSPGACYPGNSVNFSTYAVGRSVLNYQWMFNSIAIPGATNDTLALNDAQPEQQGNYSVMISNLDGSVTSSNALLTIQLPLPSIPAPPGLVSWWPADGTALDLVGGNNGLLENSVAYENRPGGGQCFNIYYIGSAVLVGDATNLQLQDFTIETWVQLGDINRVSMYGGPGYLFSFNSGGYGFGINPDGTLLLAQIDGDSVSSTNRVSDGNWHHVAVTKSSSNVLFYIDGIADPVVLFTNQFVVSPPACIGAQGSDRQFPPQSLFGAIDELGIYNRPLRSAEIQAVFQAGSGGKCQQLPSLSVLHSPGHTQIGWPVWASAFQLQSCDQNLGTPGSWSNATAVLQTNGFNVTATLPMSSQRQFFRLAYPRP